MRRRHTFTREIQPHVARTSKTSGATKISVAREQALIFYPLAKSFFSTFSSTQGISKFCSYPNPEQHRPISQNGEYMNDPNNSDGHSSVSQAAYSTQLKRHANLDVYIPIDDEQFAGFHQ